MKNSAYLTVLFLISFSAQCASLKPGGDSESKHRIGVLKCEGGDAVLYRNDGETGQLIEKGPVALGEEETCKKAASRDERTILKMKREGEWVKYYSGTKAVLEKGSYRNGKKEGLFNYYTKEGELTRTIMHKAGVKDGEEISYFPGTSEWKEKGSNSNGERTGLWQSRITKNSECIDEGNYLKGEKTGPWVECSKDEKTNEIFVSFRGTYQGGLKSGMTVMFNGKGDKTGEGMYRADLACKNDPKESDKSKCEKKSGRWIYYHGNGKKAEEGAYDAVTGKKTGVWSEYYQSGERMGTGPREHTRKGMWTFYNKNGGIFGKFNFDGTDFVVVSGEVYENGVKISESMPEKGCRTVTNRLGREVRECEREAGGFASSLLKYDRDNDELKATLKMKSGYWIEYSKTGQKIGEGSYLGGRKDGVWNELDGGRWVTRNYMMGKVK